MSFALHRTLGLLAPLAGAALCLAPAVAFADKIRHPTAIFAGLDKITGRIIAFDVAIDETVQFGTLQVTPRACYTRPPTEAPLTLGFTEVDEVSTTNEVKRIFSGWMFAASPGLHGVEHPVYDVWMTDCTGGKEIIRDVVATPPDQDPALRPSAQQPRPRQQARPVTPLGGAVPFGAPPVATGSPPAVPAAPVPVAQPRAPVSAAPQSNAPPTPPANVPGPSRRPPPPPGVVDQFR